VFSIHVPGTAQYSQAESGWFGTQVPAMVAFTKAARVIRDAPPPKNARSLLWKIIVADIEPLVILCARDGKVSMVDGVVLFGAHLMYLREMR
jgi:hypothetical protein